jgi:glycosyltransferase 2 family protein
MTARSVTLMNRLVPGLSLGFLVLIMLILLGDVSEVSSRMQQFDWGYLPLVLLLTLVNYFIRILKWHFSLGRSGSKYISFTNSAQLFLAAFPLSVSQGKISQALKGIWLKQKSGMPAGRSTQVLAAEQISDWMAVIVLSILGVVAYPIYWPVFLFVLFALLAVLVFSQDQVSLDAYGGLEKQIPALPELMLRLRQLLSGGLALYKPLSGILAFVLGVISWLGEGICLYLILLGVGLDGGFQLLATSIWITALSSLIGAVSGLPGGLGAIEVVLATSLTLFTGLSPALATTAVIIYRLATFWFKIVIGLIVWRFSPGLSGLRTKSGTIIDS